MLLGSQKGYGWHFKKDWYHLSLLIVLMFNTKLWRFSNSPSLGSSRGSSWRWSCIGTSTCFGRWWLLSGSQQKRCIKWQGWGFGTCWDNNFGASVNQCMCVCILYGHKWGIFWDFKPAQEYKGRLGKRWSDGRVYSADATCLFIWVGPLSPLRWRTYRTFPHTENKRKGRSVRVLAIANIAHLGMPVWNKQPHFQDCQKFPAWWNLQIARPGFTSRSVWDGEMSIQMTSTKLLDRSIGIWKWWRKIWGPKCFWDIWLSYSIVLQFHMCIV